jgi:hypothetical protein
MLKEPHKYTHLKQGIMTFRRYRHALHGCMSRTTGNGYSWDSAVSRYRGNTGYQVLSCIYSGFPMNVAELQTTGLYKIIQSGTLVSLDKTCVMNRFSRLPKYVFFCNFTPPLVPASQNRIHLSSPAEYGTIQVCSEMNHRMLSNKSHDRYFK